MFPFYVQPASAPIRDSHRLRAQCAKCHNSRRKCGWERPCKRCVHSGSECVEREVAPRKARSAAPVGIPAGRLVPQGELFRSFLGTRLRRLMRVARSFYARPLISGGLCLDRGQCLRGCRPLALRGCVVRRIPVDGRTALLKPCLCDAREVVARWISRFPCQAAERPRVDVSATRSVPR